MSRKFRLAIRRASFRIPETTRTARRPENNFLPATTEGIKANFFDYLAAALQFVPPTPETNDIRGKLASIGIGPGKRFEFKDLSPAHKAAVLLGMKEGDDKVDKFLASGNKNINGWNVGAFFGDRDFFKTDWVMRAGAAKGGLYGNDAVEAMYPYTRTDGKGETLDGSKHNYTITFAAGQLPPVNAFWSVTMYDGKSQLLIRNPINRYLINSPMLPSMKKNADGSADPLHPEGLPGQGEGIQLVARAQRHHLLGDALVLAEDNAAFDSAARRRDVETTSRDAGGVTK